MCFDWCMKKCRHKLCIHDTHETTCFLIVKVDLILASFLPFQHVRLLFLTKKKLKVRNRWEGNTVITVFSMSHGWFHEISQKTAGIHSSPACLLKSVCQWALDQIAWNRLQQVSAMWSLPVSNKEHGDDLYNVDCCRFVPDVTGVQ